MTSAVEESYSKLHSHLSSFHPLVASISDEISQIFKMSTSKDIEERSATVAESLVDAQLIIVDYREVLSSLEDSISKMEDFKKREEEQNNFDSFKHNIDRSTDMEVDPVSLSNSITKLERKLSLSIETAKARIIALNRPLPSTSGPSSGDSLPVPFHSTSNLGVESTSTTHPSNTAEFQVLAARLVELETKLGNNNAQRTHQPNIVLPPIRLETFDGTDITKWPAFKYQLDELILNQSQFSEVEKAFYIRSSLKGTAHSLIASIPTNKDFLPKMISRLEAEYGRPNLTQATLLQSLLRIRSKSSKLEDQLDCVRAMINIVHSISDDCGLNGIVTQQQIADRIHQRFIPVIWRGRYPTLLESLQRIEETLRIELEDVTMIRAISDSPNYQSSIVGNNRPGNVPKSNSSTKDSTLQNPKVPKGPTCVYCGLHAISGLCTTVKSAKDRKDILRRKNLCFCCLSRDHPSAGCSRKCTQCEGKHHRSICDKPSTNTAVNVVSLQQPERLFTTTATVANPSSDTSTIAHVLLDHGAQATLISRELVNRLELVPFETRNMAISGINGDPSIVTPHDIVNVDVVTNRGKVHIEAIVREGSSVNTIYTDPLPSEDLEVIQSTIGSVPSHFSEPSTVHSDLLLSIGDTLELLENSTETRLPCGYRLVQSSIGPLVVGSNKARARTIDPAVSALTIHQEETLDEKVERLFSVDPITRVYETTEKEARKVANELVNQHFDETVQKQGEEYVIQYSIKPEAATVLPSNYDLAASRLSSTLRTLSKDKSYLEYYDSIMQDQLSLGQIEEVDPNDNEGIIHYLPHQPVLRPDKPSTPLRIVYDASAHLKNKPSLNDMIHPGPSDLERIPSILLRARSRLGLIVADVEKAFLQVKLHPSQRNMLRFLWVKDPEKPATSSNIRVFRFCVTPFGINASPSILNKVIHHHLRLNGSECDPILVNQLISNLYVDNVIINVDLPLSRMYTQSKDLFDSMSMNLRDFASNDPSFLSIVDEADRAKSDTQKLLGLLWDTSTDRLSINIPISNKDGRTTKRNMLSMVCSPYDPLGLLNPLTLPPRLTTQNLWNFPLKWDDPVDESTREAFHEQMNELEKFSLPIDRYAHLSDSDSITLVCFSDASKQAMATCIYNWSSDANPTLLISKTRLAPIKSNSTIPKMELESLVMAHPLARFTIDSLRKEFPDKQIDVYFYSDSAVVLHWCRPEFKKPVGVFVTNRIQMILEAKKDLISFGNVIYHHPRHVRSEDNPADHATRGLSAKEMNNPEHQWWLGPDWMKSDPQSWPNEDLSSLQCPSMDSFPMAISAVAISPPVETVIDLTRFSSLRKAITVAANVYRFISRCAHKSKNSSIHEKLKHLPISSSPVLSASERRFAFNSLVRLHQMRYIPSDDSVAGKSNLILDPQTRVWKANTRLINSSLTSDAKSPVFIPTSIDSVLAKLIISDIHRSSSHANVDVILNLVKRKYWIPRCRQIAKSVLKSCVSCRKTNNLPFRYPKSPALPQERVRKSLPFENCGVDYAGPFNSSTDEKMYVVVFTCFATRLSHLEVVNSLLPATFIFAFRRFCARRGTPTHITSDKATTFKMASTLFSKTDADENVNTLLSNLGIHWSFTTAHSPWKGGIYERLVKILKESLSRTIGRRKLSIEEFTTVVCEIEALLNSRPLSYVSSDDVQSFHGPVLRPIDLISPESFLGCSIILSDQDDDYKPPDEENSSREAAIQQLKRSVTVVDSFWNKWHHEYLTTLRDCSSRSDPLHSGKSTPYLPVRGSLVLVVDESGNTPRSSWKMAKILSITETSATLKSHAGRVIERPLNLLIPLEIHSSDDSTQPPVPEPDPEPVNIHPMTTRSKGKDDLNRDLTPDPTTSNTKETEEEPLKEAKSTKAKKRTNHDQLVKDITDRVEKRMRKQIESIATNVVTEGVYLINKHIDSIFSDLSTAVFNIHDIVSKPSEPAIVDPPRVDHPPSTSRSPHLPLQSSTNSTPSSVSSRNLSRSPMERNFPQSRNLMNHQSRRNRSRSRSPIHRHHVNLPQCVFCQSVVHLTKNCNVVTSISLRTNIARAGNRCLKCFRVLNQNHRVDCEPNLCNNGCVNPQGGPMRHCLWLCPNNPDLQP